MLSRLALRNAQVIPAAMRGIQNLPTTSAVDRPNRLVDPLPVRFGFIPDSWFTFFYPKTGVSGPYMFILTFGTYLVSKEIYILEHEFYNSLSLFLILGYGIKKFGPKVKAFADKERQEIEQILDSPRDEEIQTLNDVIKEIETEQWRVEAQKMIYEAKKQDVLVQLESIYRERMAHAYSEVKKRLDYNVQIDAVERRIAQKHLVQWVIDNVLKAITPDQEKATLQQCIADLQALSKA